MTGTEIIAIDVQGELAALEKRHRAANSVGMQVLNIVGTQAENLLERLPDRVKDRLEETTGRALETAARAAAGFRARPSRENNIGGTASPRRRFRW